MIEAILMIHLQTKQLCVIEEKTSIMHVCYDIAIGKEATPTPVDAFAVTRLVKEPQYVSCQTGVNYGAGFLGTYAIVTNLPTTLPNCNFAIHGTNKPGLIGTEASAGCVRMRNDDISHLVETFQFTRGVVTP